MKAREYEVPVRGGGLHVAEWGPSDGPVLVAIHGITASHMEWADLADALPEVRLVAPDLRGRGASSELPGPWGMQQHAADVVAVLDHLGLPSAFLVGHSMGGFVTVVTANEYPSRVSGMLLVDGGLTLPLPAGATLESALALLGPAGERLKMTFPSHEAYREFWAAHPSFSDGISLAMADYIAYDLVPAAGGFRSRTNPEAMKQDAVEGFGVEALVAAVEHIRPGTTLLSSPRGLQNETPGLYSPEALSVWQRDLPSLRIIEVPDTNHYTIVMGAAGAAVVARYARELLGLAG